MKRALIVGGGTVMGVAAVLALNPDGVATTSVAHSTSQGSTTSSGSTTSGSTTSGSASGGSTSGGSTSSGSTTVAGSAVDVGYGTVQVQVTLTSGRIVDITALSLPQNDMRSSMISQRAFPQLVSQALEAQSSQIAGVSGASYTSQGFVESLRAALTQAEHAA